MIACAITIQMTTLDLWLLFHVRRVDIYSDGNVGLLSTDQRDRVDQRGNTTHCWLGHCRLKLAARDSASWLEVINVALCKLKTIEKN